MEYVVVFGVGTVISWIALLVVIPIAQKLAEFSMPPWPETLWKLAVVAAAGNVVAIVLDPVNIWLSWLAGGVVFFTFMVKWFDVDLFGGIIIVVISWILRAWLGQLILGLLSAAV